MYHNPGLVHLNVKTPAAVPLRVQHIIIDLDLQDNRIFFITSYRRLINGDSAPFHETLSTSHTCTYTCFVALSICMAETFLEKMGQKKPFNKLLLGNYRIFLHVGMTTFITLELSFI